jgi:hypothetical protein
VPIRHFDLQQRQIPQGIRKLHHSSAVGQYFFTPLRQSQVAPVIASGQHHTCLRLRTAIFPIQNPHRNRLVVHDREDLVGTAHRSAQQAE